MNANQKVASLFVLFGAELAGELLKRLPEHEAGKVLRALSQMPGVEPADMDSVCAEFLKLLKSPSRGHSGGKSEVGTRVLAAASAILKDDSWVAGNALEHLAAQIRDRLEGLPPGVVARWLSNERPQTIALTLSLMRPGMGAEVLKSLPTAQHPNICIAIVNLKPVDAQTLEILLDEVEQLRGMGKHARSVDGTSTIVAMLQKVSPEFRDSLLTSLADRDTELAESIKLQVLTVERISELYPKDLARVCGLLPDKELGLVLRLEKQEVRDRFFAVVSKNRRETLCDEVTSATPVKRSDAEAVRAKFIAMVLDLHVRSNLLFPWEESLVS